MKITIITIVYNGAKEIEKTIKSVLKQKRKEVEYIIIDGKSVDNTMKIVGQYANNIDIISSESDDGIADAFNKGIKLAHGDYIGLINSGDILLEGVIDYLIEHETELTSYDILYGDCQIDDKQNNRIYIKEAFPLEKIWYGLPFSHQACFISKKAYDYFGMYDVKYKICMDYALIREMYAKGAKFLYMPIQIARFATEGISYRKPVQTMKEAMYIATQYGLPQLKATVYAIKHIGRHYIKRLLEIVGLFKIISKIKDKRVDYSGKSHW